MFTIFSQICQDIINKLKLHAFEVHNFIYIFIILSIDKWYQNNYVG